MRWEGGAGSQECPPRTSTQPQDLQTSMPGAPIPPWVPPRSVPYLPPSDFSHPFLANPRPCRSSGRKVCDELTHTLIPSSPEQK